MAAWKFHDRPEAMEMRRAIAASILGMVEKSAGPLFACSEFVTVMSATVGCIQDGPWKQVMKAAEDGPKECPCKTCEVMHNLMVALDELRTAARANQLTTMADAK